MRRELCQHFGSYPLVADGILLRTWRGGPQAGEPKLPPPVKTMIERACWNFAAKSGGFALILPPPV